MVSRGGSIYGKLEWRKRAGDPGSCAAVRSSGLGRHPEPGPGIRISRDAAPPFSGMRCQAVKPLWFGRTLQITQYLVISRDARWPPAPGAGAVRRHLVPGGSRCRDCDARSPVSESLRVTPSHSESLRLLRCRRPGAGWVACI